MFLRIYVVFNLINRKIYIKGQYIFGDFELFCKFVSRDGLDVVEFEVYLYFGIFFKKNDVKLDRVLESVRVSWGF